MTKAMTMYDEQNENLMSGSKIHLPAFAGQIENLGIVYKAQYLSPDEVDSTVDSPVELGR